MCRNQWHPWSLLCWFQNNTFRPSNFFAHSIFPLLDPTLRRENLKLQEMIDLDSSQIFHWLSFGKGLWNVGLFFQLPTKLKNRTLCMHFAYELHPALTKTDHDKSIVQCSSPYPMASYRKWCTELPGRCSCSMSQEFRGGTRSTRIITCSHQVHLEIIWYL